MELKETHQLLVQADCQFIGSKQIYHKEKHRNSVRC